MASVLQLIGAGLIVVGVALFSLPAGVIAAGVFAVLIGLAVRK